LNSVTTKADKPLALTTFGFSASYASNVTPKLNAKVKDDANFADHKVANDDTNHGAKYDDDDVEEEVDNNDTLVKKLPTSLSSSVVDVRSRKTTVKSSKVQPKGKVVKKSSAIKKVKPPTKKQQQYNCEYCLPFMLS
jgi:hypothetical protein